MHKFIYLKQTVRIRKVYNVYIQIMHPVQFSRCITVLDYGTYISVHVHLNGVSQVL